MKVKGFTLLEVIVAMAVLAIAGLSLLRAGNEHLVHLSHLRQNLVADWVADNKIAEIRIVQQADASEGQVKMAKQIWYWKVIVGTPNRWLIPFKVEVRRLPNLPPIVVRTGYLGKRTS